MVFAASPAPSRQVAFDYDRTVVAFHGTRRATAERLVSGEPFGASTNDDDWLGHGIYFWEFAPQQAWRWAVHRYGEGDAAVLGALVRLGRCFDLLDPSNADVLHDAHAEMSTALAALGQPLPKNANANKFLDCAVFNWLYQRLGKQGLHVQSSRAVFVPVQAGRLSRVWERSGIFRGAHIQVCVRERQNILAAWSVRRDGRYGRD
jgi:hypothetical protein